jgi:hypothetical protein
MAALLASFQAARFPERRHMRAEIQTMVDAVKQAIALLRRHL